MTTFDPAKQISDYVMRYLAPDPSLYDEYVETLIQEQINYVVPEEYRDCVTVDKQADRFVWTYIPKNLEEKKVRGL